MDTRPRGADKLVAIFAVIAFFAGIHLASAGNFPTSLNGFNDYPATNSTIYSADFNNVESAVGTLTSTSSNSINYLIRNTSTPLGSIRGLSNVTGSLIYYLNSVWNSLSPGSSGQLLTVSSTAGVPVPYWSSSAAGATISATGGEVLLSSGGNVATSSRNLAMNTTTMTLSIGGIASSSEVRAPSGTISTLFFTSASGTTLSALNVSSSYMTSVTSLQYATASGTQLNAGAVSSTNIEALSGLLVRGIASTTELRAASATLASARDIQGNKYVTSTAVASINFCFGNEVSNATDTVYTAFYATSTILDVYAVNSPSGLNPASGSIGFNLTITSSTSYNSTSGRSMVFTTEQRITATTSSVKLTPNGSTTASTGYSLGYMTGPNSSSSEFCAVVHYTTP